MDPLTRLTDEQLSSLERYYTPASEQKCPRCGAPLKFSSANGDGSSVYHCSSDDANPIRSKLLYKDMLAHRVASSWHNHEQASPFVVSLIQEVRRGRVPYVRAEAERKDYMEEFETHWNHLVCRGDQLDIDAVARELSDYMWLMGAASEVYINVTGGRIGNQLTLPEVVIQQADEVCADVITDGIRDAMEALYRAAQKAKAPYKGNILVMIAEEIRQNGGKVPGAS